MLEFKRVAHQQNRMVLLAVRDGELVHNAAVDTDEPVLRPLRQLRDIRAVDRVAFQRQQRKGCGDLERCRGG